jgi:hypothetical protein
MSSAAHFGVHSVATQGLDHGPAFVETAACTRRVSKEGYPRGGWGGGRRGGDHKVLASAADLFEHSGFCVGLFRNASCSCCM